MTSELVSVDGVTIVLYYRREVLEFGSRDRSFITSDWKTVKRDSIYGQNFEL